MSFFKRTCILGLLAATAIAAEPGDIVITGQRVTENTRAFEWTVTNNADKPVVYFRVPRYLADTAEPPDGWNWDITPKTAGVREVAYTARSNADGIYPQRSKTFRIEDTNSPRGITTRGTATVRLSDGTELTIADVPCIGPEPDYLKQLPAIGLGVMFGAFLLWKVLRRKPTAPAGGAEAGEPAP